MDIGKICEVVSTELGIGEVREAGLAKIDIEKVCEVVSTELGIGEVREAALAKIDIEKVREAASIHYGDLTNDEKQAAGKFFEAMDQNKSKKISIDEFRTFLSHAKIQTDDCEWLFKVLDKDKSNTLGFQELVTFFYLLSRDEYKHLLNYRPGTDIHGRKGQKSDMGLVSGLHGKSKRAHKVGEWENEAGSMEIGKEKVCEAVLAEINIEKVQKAASAHYKDLTEDEKQAARSLFESMDKDNSGNISTSEFMDFLSFTGFQNNEHGWLFEELDKDNNATLNLEELATFFSVLSRNDEDKHLLNYQGQQWNKRDLAGLYDKLKRAYKVVEWENECSIV